MKLRRIGAAAGVAMAIALGVETLWAGYSSDTAVRMLQLIAVVALGSVIVFGFVAIALVQLGGWQEPSSDSDFDRLVQRSESLASRPPFRPGGGIYGSGDARAYDWADDENGVDRAADSYLSADEQAEFQAALADAVHALPLPLHGVLEHVAVVVSDNGAEVQTAEGTRGAYGLYTGGTIARDYFHDRVLIFRDTLMRDFGDDPLRLRAEISRTLRHELAHHLGYDEQGVRDLGL